MLQKDVYSTPGTFPWTKNPDAKVIFVTVVGAGGPGAGGARGASSVLGGGGGAGGASHIVAFDAAFIGASGTVVIATGGTPGLGRNTNGAGNPGVSDPVPTSFTDSNGMVMSIPASGPGTAAAGGANSGLYSQNGQAGTAPSIAGTGAGTSNPATGSTSSPGGGTAGGSITVAAAPGPGGNSPRAPGLAVLQGSTLGGLGSTTGDGAPGVNGFDNAVAALVIPFAGGGYSVNGGTGGGASSFATGNGGKGGDGGSPGAGGGGGGACIGGTSGAGGLGAPGCVSIIQMSGPVNPLLDGLLSWWNITETSGDRLDSVGGKTLSPVLGQDGITPTAIFARPNGTDFHFGNQDVTVSAWFRLNTTFGSQTILGKWSPTEANGGNWFFGHTVGGTPPQNSLRFGWASTPGPSPSANSISLAQVGGTVLTSAPIVTGVWYHVVWQHRAGIGHRVALNGGTLTAALWTEVLVAAFLASTVSHFAVKGRVQSAGIEAGGFNGIDGDVRDVAIWNRLLTDAQVALLWNGGVPKHFPG